MNEGDAPSIVPLHSTAARGQGTNVVMLHGLFGSASNLRALARGLETHYRVLSIDLRNHGNSGHAESMRYEEMAADVAAHLRQHEISGPLILVGHSMGGKVAMSCALMQAISDIAALVVLDIAPVDYQHDFTDIVQAMLDLETRLQEGRSAVDALLAQDIPELVLRSFLMKNLVRGQDGSLRWRLNLRAIKQNIATIHGFPEQAQGKRYAGPALFLSGEHSDYLHRDHHDPLLQHFPNARIISVPDSGHWLHAQQPDAVLAHIRQFLSALPSNPTAQ